MKLHIIYQQYPYGSQETFAEAELEELCRNFSDINVYSFSAVIKKPRKIPHNCKLVAMRENNVIYANLLAFCALFSVTTFVEIIFLIKKYKAPTLKNLKRIYNYYVHRFLFKLNFDFDSLNDGDIVYSYWTSDIAYAALQTKHKNKNIKLISRAHGFDAYFERGYQPFRREILSNLDHLYCISESGRDSITRYFGSYINKDRISVARLGVVIPEGSELMRYKKSNLIVTCSNIIPLKRLDLLIDALALLDESIEWIHFGDGFQQNEIIKYAHERLDAKRNIKWKFAGRTPHEKVMEFYRSTNIGIFINCSDYEGVPVSLMEAMVYGIPCIARNVGGVSELIQDHNNGILLPYELDSTILSMSIKEILLEESSNLEKLCLNAKETIRRKYNSKNNFKELSKKISLM